MRLAAIYNIWNEEELLFYSKANIRPLVDVVIIVYSNTSNFGEKTPPEMTGNYHFDFGDDLADVFYRQMEPDLKRSPRDNETAKRNYGLNVARELGCTHFLTMDADEFYEHEPFLKDKARFHVEPELQGLIATCTTYFRSPKLTIGLDVTMVPFIHKLTPKIQHCFNKNYPFAWEGHSIRVDPTRSFNINSGVHIAESTMHHYSWVRKDFNRKIRNSSARTNLERSCILKSLLDAKEGGYCEYYQKTLVRASVDFGIPEIYESNEIDHSALH